MDNIFELLLQYNKKWTSQNVITERLNEALTNDIYKVTNKNTGYSVIVRIYGYAISEKQQYLIKFLGDEQLAPKIYFYNNLGSVEEFYEGISMKRCEFVNPKFYHKIAIKLRHLHDKNIVHNDLHYNNIMIHHSELKFIDFEFARKTTSKVEKMMDIANLFCEWMYDYSQEKWYDFDIENFPSFQIRYDFCKVYNNYHTNTIDIVNEITEQMPTIHSRWIEWGIKKYLCTNNKEFLIYAEKRAKISKKLFLKYGEKITKLHDNS